ncbi:phosphoribosylformylglycinamidine synthase [Klebsiella pneumoniae]|nr:phosphoribosylformylglycinamidine synthase [Klebsiella pneumoniae]
MTSESGRATIMMPHPERVFRTVSNSWHPENWGEDSPWMRIFRNARKQLVNLPAALHANVSAPA